MQQKLEFNSQGLTFREWLDAAGVVSTTNTWLALRAAWKAGADPSEYQNN